MRLARRSIKAEGRYYFKQTPLPGIDYSINPYFGCEFGCRYCYSMVYFKLKAIPCKWGEYVEAKTYLPRILSKKLSKFKRDSKIGIGTYTDPYQPWEASLNLTRKILKILNRRGDLKVVIETKSPLILRDIDILKDSGYSVVFTITSLDERYAKYFEPYAPRPFSRLKAASILIDNGVDVSIFIAPLMPFINDEKDYLEKIIEGIARAGVKKFYSDVLRFRIGVRESLISVLKEYNSSLISYYMKLNRPMIFERYSDTVDFLQRKADEYKLEYVDIAKEMWDYLK